MGTMNSPVDHFTDGPRAYRMPNGEPVIVFGLHAEGCIPPFEKRGFVIMESADDVFDLSPVCERCDTRFAFPLKGERLLDFTAWALDMLGCPARPDGAER